MKGVGDEAVIPAEAGIQASKFPIRPGPRSRRRLAAALQDLPAVAFAAGDAEVIQVFQ
jgi:hypothetical protein